MKMKLAILDHDINYLTRIVAAFSAKYESRLEIYSYTDPDMALNSLESIRADVFLANERYEIPVKDLPGRCGFAYFVEENGLETFRGQTAVCKYQRADLIYNQILSIYSEKAEGSMKGGSGTAEMFWFTSAGGGCGSSSMAAAAAISFAKKGNKVLYLGLDAFGDTDCYFEGMGQFDFSDVIYALKGKKNTLTMKLESSLRQDTATEVYFYGTTGLALDMMELNQEDVKLLVDSIKSSGLFDMVVIDKRFALDEISKCLWETVNGVIMVNDGSEIGNSKFLRALESLKVLAEHHDHYRLDKLFLLYNKFSNKTANTLEGIDITLLGGIPRYEHASVKQILTEVSDMNIFDKLL